jgi:hypothetical protein
MPRLRSLLTLSTTALLLAAPGRALAADLIMNGGTVTLGGVQTYNIVSLTNGAKVLVTPYNGLDKTNTGSLVIKANTITIDATSSVTAKGTGYQATLCRDGNGPTTFPLSGGRGGCGVFDSAGGGAHFGNGGRGTKDCSAGGCTFPADYEENCVGAVNGTNTACVSLTNCRNNDALPTVAGQSFSHSIYVSDFGAAGGDKGCRDGWDTLSTGGNGGGRIVLFAANAGQTGTMNIAGTVSAKGNRGCGNGNDSAGGGAGGTVLLVGDTVTVAATAVVNAAGGRGGDTQAKVDTECAGTQMSGTCDDCGGGGGGGIISVLSRLASIAPAATFDVSGALGGVCPICTGEAGGGAGELQIDGAYVGEVCDGYDNDFNGTVDDGLPPIICNGVMTPSCVNGVPQQCAANVPACIASVTDTRPRFVVIVDTSGSMLNDVTGKPTFGDGSLGHIGVDTNSDVDTVDGNNSRLFIAKSALNNVLAAFPQADYALARYHQDVSTNRSCQAASWFECQNLCCSYDDPRNNVAPLYPAAPGCNLQGLYSAGYPAALGANINVGWPNQGDCINYAGSCGAPRRGADVIVGFNKPLQQSLKWLDGAETSFKPSTIPGDHCDYAGGGDCELRATGPTPLGASLDAAADYLKPIIQCDGAVPCRKYSVILLTDGAESCQGNPIASATALRNVVPATDVKTYVIGFSTLPTETAQLNAVATAGGTTAFFASDSSGISNAFASIIAASTNYEKCNGLDDDCDGLIDEDFPDKGATCDNGLKGVCKGTGVRICNATQDGTTCQITVPGLAPKAEVCNGLDDNCNGLVDEGGVCQLCVPTVEVCNNIDDNCDGIIDNNPVDANQPCGVATGECAPGVTACGPGGVLTCTGAIGPQGETCNGLDDDCNGVVDGMTAACYAGPVGTSGVGVCHPGSQPCTAVVGSGVPAYGPCVGQIVPSTELCDGLDNDCNGKVDDKVPDGFGHMTGDACCPSAGKCAVGVCTFGAYACAGSQVVCDGAILPSPELCDGLDNDCNGTVDDVPGKGIACVLPGGCPGMLDCQVGVGLVCVSAATGVEICDGIDNDCDGSIDEEPDVSVNDPKLGVVCDVPAAPNDKAPCAPGKTVCKSGKPVCGGAVTPAPEVCDGVDNDCDGNVDQPNPCAGELVCTNGMCLGKCQGGEFPCPGGEACMNGVCVPAMTDGGMPAGSSGASGSSGAGGSASGTTTTSGSGGAGGVPSTSATSTTTGVGVTTSGAGGAGGDPNVFGLATGGGGCACDVAGDRGIPGRLALITAVGLALGARRRRRSPRVAGGAQ